MSRHFARGAQGAHDRGLGAGVQAQHRRHARGAGRALIDLLLAAGAAVRAYDPVAADAAQRIYAGRAGLALARSAYQAAEGADALAIVTEWQEFRSPDFERLKEMLKSPVIFDGRNLYDPSTVSRFGLTYYAIGRGKPLAAD